MAWNEPGDGKKDNPWGNKKPQEGPPDLDEILKNLVVKLKRVFGFKASANAGPSSGLPKQDAKVILLVVSGLAILAYVVFGFYTISSYEQGVITRFGKYNRTVNSGLHWVPRFIDQIEIVNTESVTSLRQSGKMLTKDENILLVEMEVLYRIIDAEKYVFNITDPKNVLAEAAESALRQVIGDSLTDDVLTDKKQQISDAIKDQLVDTLKGYNAGFLIQAVNFRDSRPPDEVKDAFDDVTKSREDKERLKLQAEAYLNTIIPEAEGAAKKILSEAEAYKESVTLDAVGETQRFNSILPGYLRAPQVAKTRMYLDTMEQVFKNTTKVVVSSGSGNNLIYLPLDKLVMPNDAANNAVVPYKDDATAANTANSTNTTTTTSVTTIKRDQ